MRTKWLAVAVVVVLSGAMGPLWADAPTEEPELDQKLTLREKDAQEDERKFFWFIGTSNYNIGLKASEAKIDRVLNRPLGRIFPRWERPTTFKDWNDERRIWDLWGGFGRELTDRLSLSVYSGGGYGEITNRQTLYPLGFALKVDADIRRTSFFVGTGLRFYPWGRPVKEEEGWRGALRGAKALCEANAGYNLQLARAEVTFTSSGLGKLVRVVEKERYDMLFFSPRVGVEFPMSEDNSFNVVTGYTFLSKQQDDFNGFIFEFFFQRRFSFPLGQ